MPGLLFGYLSLYTGTLTRYLDIWLNIWTLGLISRYSDISTGCQDIRSGGQILVQVSHNWSRYVDIGLGIGILGLVSQYWSW